MFPHQGLSHGHYDKLSYSMFEKGSEFIQDYGMVRFVNIEQKGGGNYLKENNSWSKQSIAHNTIVQNETSHFMGQYEIGSKHHSELYFFDASNKNIQVISAKERNAYPGTVMHRTIAMIMEDSFEKPFVVDIMKVVSENANQYDLPFHFLGQLIQVNFEYDSPSTLKSMGNGNGYQHLWLEGKGSPASNNTKLLWMNEDKFYSLTTATNRSDELLLTRLGANDPEFNLRRDAALIIRRKNSNDTVFASVIEPHGYYSAVSEFSVNSKSSIADLKVVHDDANYTAVIMEDTQGERRLFVLSNLDDSEITDHRLRIGDEEYRWMGPYYYGNVNSK